MDARHNLARSKNMRMKGLVATNDTFHVEGGKGTQWKVLKFRLRPDPLAN